MQLLLPPVTGWSWWSPMIPTPTCGRGLRDRYQRSATTPGAGSRSTGTAGSTLSMLPDAGDRIREHPHAVDAAAPSPAQPTRCQHKAIWSPLGRPPGTAWVIDRAAISLTSPRGMSASWCSRLPAGCSELDAAVMRPARGGNGGSVGCVLNQVMSGGYWQPRGERRTCPIRPARTAGVRTTVPPRTVDSRRGEGRSGLRCLPRSAGCLSA